MLKYLSFSINTFFKGQTLLCTLKRKGLEKKSKRLNTKKPFFYYYIFSKRRVHRALFRHLLAKGSLNPPLPLEPLPYLWLGSTYFFGMPNPGGYDSAQVTFILKSSRLARECRPFSRFICMQSRIFFFSTHSSTGFVPDNEILQHLIQEVKRFSSLCCYFLVENRSSKCSRNATMWMESHMNSFFRTWWKKNSDFLISLNASA